MLARSTTLGPSLALLAVCLQIAVAAIGGRICMRMAPLPASDGCLSWCCDEHESSTGGSWVQLDGQQSLACPADAGCCLEVATEYFTTATGVSGLKDLDAPVPALPALVPRTGQVEIAIRRLRANGPGDAHPPPSMKMIRSTVLRL